ncbi:hemerythrin domain-containing protein [uncultured Massilia sp.]|uniref:hemerythrin domain-containing protein n=1 Tax=uncultured Massilia sp. TaxID=169973 RepID=UPI0025EE2979|nr:hemerythrin domain-containing protein [uncultured Massilia sp.]
MLTSTYTLVALSIEQATARTVLQALLDALHALPGDVSSLVPARAASLCGMLRQAYDDCHWRKLDKFVVPALRRGTGAADALLGELEALSAEAAEAMTAAEACVGDGAAHRVVPRAAFHAAVERSVAALRLRLEREERELLPLARGAVGGDAWFAIANQMLAHDAWQRERRAVPRRAAPAAVPDDPAGPGGRVLAAAMRDGAQPEPGWRRQALAVVH